MFRSHWRGLRGPWSGHAWVMMDEGLGLPANPWARRQQGHSRVRSDDGIRDGRSLDLMAAARPRQLPRCGLLGTWIAAPRSVGYRICVRLTFMSTVTRPRRTPQPELRPDPIASAKAAGLRYVSDARPGIRRK